ncbi:MULTISPECIES: GNAT family N-acetyltransferase [Mycolicibacterium]|uniref:Lysine N-acyltransferase MbtK n=2 Tax=Mycolicibacterium TaxID=1866885 RepID=A0ABX3VD72_9MYCO|nr:MULTISPECIES: GNAT family N-acetyltransferase [Mycolicibacterium]OBK03188.1 siderophore biosynthesis protein [Mycolicibacterium conceptionense]OMB80660.1 siderophore biosynthesis protein [Mycolicibacterium conceptionense]OMB83901.1 siderophore biosynthesis protein [Mycolicibacterium conceptionense]ORV29487.1 siderophore biosynthesis protein [Mycolicibacterium conceptionense]QZH69024.1 acetyltransferase [Mycolicibacterium farcinogenes]
MLPRERKNVSEVIRSTPAPPVPQLLRPSKIRVATGTDAAMIAEWMNRPHLAKAWEYDWPVERWRTHLEAQLEGDYSLPLVLSIGGVDRGYLEIYRAAKDSIADRYDSAPHDLGLHGAIADEELVNRGLGPMLLPKIVASVLAADPDCRRIMFDPDHRNTTVRGLCEFAGCKFLGEHQMSNRRMALYQLDRATARKWMA